MKMATQRSGVDRFINRTSNITGDLQDIKVEQHAQRPQNGVPSQMSTSRQRFANDARIKPPQTKLVHTINEIAEYSANVPSSAAQRPNGRPSNPSSRSMPSAIKQESPRRRADIHDAFDTDAENIDDTSTMSIGVQVKDSQSQTTAHPYTHVLRNNVQRAPDIPQSSAIPAETLYAEGGHDGFGEDTPYEEHHEFEEEDSQGEEGEDSDESAEEEPAEEDPTLSLGTLPKQWIARSEEDEFSEFTRALNSATSLSTSKFPATEDPVRSSLQTNGRSVQERRSAVNHGRPIFPSASNGIKENARPTSRSREPPILAQQASHQGQGKRPIAPATPSWTQALGDIQSIQAERQGPQTQTGRPVVSSPNLATALPQHPKKVQGVVSDARGSISGTPVLEVLSIGPTEDAGGFPQGDLPPGNKRAFELDYSGEDLSRMTYGQLKSETFDHDPSAPPSVLPTDLQSESLERQLTHICNLPIPSDEHPLPEHQRFFSSLPIDKYEECGDLILDKFAEIINKFKKARQDKRQHCRDFEDEVSKREALVSARVGALDKDMGRLRKAGEEVIRGKTA